MKSEKKTNIKREKYFNRNTCMTEIQDTKDTIGREKKEGLRKKETKK